MPTKNFHKSFDKSTKTKLLIFNKYFKESFPVFLYTKFWDEILIYDFFSGMGYDDSGEKSTSLNILEQIKPYCQKISEQHKKLQIFLNDMEYKEELEKNVSEYIANCKTECTLDCILTNDTLTITDRDFNEYFDEVYETIKNKNKSAKLIFLDPFNFILDKDRFAKLTHLRSTDFICFLPSSYLRRFREFSGFKSFIDTKNIDFDNSKPAHCHRVIAEYFETLIPVEREYYIGCFSIKKGSNYYGLIFGSNHTLGAEKFNTVCWSLDNLTGEADFDIDSEPSFNLPAGTLFEEFNTSTKLQDFKQNLVDKIMSGTINTDIKAYKFALKKRCLVKHATEVLKDLMAKKKIQSMKTITTDIHKHEPQAIVLL
jgi:three-Cys-motif partner protein